MKIKQKKQLNLPQLIEWAQDNIEEATKKVYRVNENEVLGHHVRFTEVYSDLEVRLHGYIPFDSTFTVEIEEEITEDTVIPELVELYEDTLRSSEGSNEILVNKNTSIRRAKDVDECPSRAFYILNDDYTMTLIWRDGKLVE